ncbi:MAG: hypothetical protein ACI35Q_08410 [Marinilabiliaceae bacterium]
MTTTKNKKAKPRKATAGTSVRKAIRKAAAIVRSAVRDKTHNEKAARLAGRAVRGAARQTIAKNAGKTTLE